MVKKSIQKKQKERIPLDDLQECTKVGHLRNAITSRIEATRKNLNVTLLFEDGVKIRFEFKTLVGATELMACIERWNKRASIRGLELVYKPQESKDVVVRTLINRLSNSLPSSS